MENSATAHMHSVVSPFHYHLLATDILAMKKDDNKNKQKNKQIAKKPLSKGTNGVCDLSYFSSKFTVKVMYQPCNPNAYDMVAITSRLLVK